MSKMDELRALREAHYEQSRARAAAHRAPTTRRAERPASGPVEAQRAPVEHPAAEAPRAEAPPVEAPEPVLEERLCGHRAISGRTCTREHGHAAKSHRYS